MSDTPRTDEFARAECCDLQHALDFARKLEREIEDWKDKLDGSEITHEATRADLRDCKRELEQERRSPYIDSDESPVEVLAAIYDALDGITDDPWNGYNFGTLVSRVKAAVQDAKHCEQERQDRKQADLDTIRALGERNDERQRADRMAAWLVDYLRELDWVYDATCNCPDCEFVRGIKTALGETEP